MNFILLVRGESVGTARVLAVSADQRLVNRFARELVDETAENERPEGSEPLHLVPGGEATDD